MKKILTLTFLSFLTLQLMAQTPPLNFTLIGQHPYNQESSDIWGYYHQATGVEYAIVGLNGGTSIISLEDPTLPQEIAFFPGTNSIWRDIKTWDHYAYVVNDDGGGMDIIDFSPLPMNPPTKITWEEELPNTGILDNCHNLFIDEFGFAYLAGSNLNNGGVVILDLKNNPLNPNLVGKAPPVYAHDVYVRNHKMYTSDIGAGVFSIYDVENKATIIFQANQATPFNYTHNTWLSKNSEVLFTTDETADAPVAAYDVSNPNDIQYLDAFVPYETKGKGVIPHNVHVWEDWLVISYYTDGCIIVDATRPENLVEVGNFDSFIPDETGFLGVWGAYPFLPSGLVLISDIESGLYVLEPTYVRACYFEGIVRSSIDDNGLNGATVKILNTNVNEQADFSGNVKTGFAVSGTYQVEFSHPTHNSKTVEFDLVNGEITSFDVTLEAKPFYAFSGTVKDKDTGEPIAGAIVSMQDAFIGEVNTSTNDNGQFTFDSVVEGEYEMVVGKWGYKTEIYDQDLFANASREVEIQSGIQDNFSLDLGWTITTNAPQGAWERGAPIAVGSPVGPITPGMDFGDDDIGNSCYVTGNNADLFNGVLIDGTTNLTSPVFDLSNWGQPELIFTSWMFAFDLSTNNASNDILEVKISNGMTEVVLDEITYGGLGSPLNWEVNAHLLADAIELTDQMQVTFTAEASNDNRVVESAIDFFEIADLDPPTAASKDLFLSTVQIKAQPNPSKDAFNLQYQLPDDYSDGQLVIYNILGKEMTRFDLTNAEGQIAYAPSQKGVYLAQVVLDGKVNRSIKLVRQ